MKGFVAVARRMSITLAAADLCLTQSAVSRQIAGLEQALGTRLFVRGHRALRLSPDGARLFQHLDPLFEQLQHALDPWLGAAPSKTVTVTASVGMAALWLLPRLPDFHRQHPDIDVRVSANDRVVDLRAEGIDLALRYCANAAPPEGSRRLFGEALVPVAAPGLLRGRKTLARALPQATLLEFDHPDRPWLQWQTALATRGLTPPSPRPMLRFNQYDQVIQACLAGQGLALGRLALVAPLIEQGRLVALEPVQHAKPLPDAYWLVAHPQGLSPSATAFADWLAAQATQAGVSPA